MKREGAGYVIG